MNAAPKPAYDNGAQRVLVGDCLDVMATLPAESVDSVVTDPPYGLGFMGKAWDELPPGREWAEACYRLLKPGGHLVAFGGTRTWHRLAVAIEDAGFEIRDSIAWMYGSGFPKSLDVSKAIDKAAGAQRTKVPGVLRNPKVTGGTFGVEGTPRALAAAERGFHEVDSDEPVTPEAAAWRGWGTALKPGFEPVVVARKPLDGTVAGNVLRHGPGALNIDGCRVATTDAEKAAINAKHAGMDMATYERRPGVALGLSVKPMQHQKPAEAHELGRWPANVVLDVSQADQLDQQSGTSKSRVGQPRVGKPGEGWGMSATGAEYEDEGGASRYFLTVDYDEHDLDMLARFYYSAKPGGDERVRVNGIAHTTVKPIALMRWLARLVTPPGGTVLETFAGSGTTAEACLIEGFQCIAIEREAEYVPLIVQRLNRRLNPVEAVRGAGEEGGLFDLLKDEAAAP